MKELKSHRARIATRSVAGGGSNTASRMIILFAYEENNLQK
jgi:hypothetical protein